jgi:vancomycin resistance protein YoaR
LRAMKIVHALFLTATLAVAVAVAQTSPPLEPIPPSVPVPTPPPSVPVPPTPPSVPVAPPPAPVAVPPPPKPPAPKPAPKPVAPKPTAKPAEVKPLEIALDTSEPEIRGGELNDVRIVRVWKMPVESVKVSRQLTKISNGIETELKRALSSVKRNAVDALWSLEGNTKQWVARQQSAWTVDETQTRANVLEAVKFNKSLAKIALRRTPPARNVQDWYAKGIRYHFGGGESSFRGSPTFRVQNIVAGSRQIDNTYLGAGEVFDFNSRVKISAALGFVEGYIISGGTLAKDIGGGICQVSTTVWRAAYNAGLPIVQRNNHSYRVHYYDPPGFEATVFSPYKNLKFKNDTGSPMFIQMTWYTRSGRLTLDFFGAKPDRRVSITDPYIYNVRPPAGPRYQADPNVRLGRVRRIDSPERGMSVRINRTVSYDDGRKVSDSTRSTYVPWGAIYAVNPQDYRVAPPKPKPVVRAPPIAPVAPPRVVISDPVSPPSSPTPPVTPPPATPQPNKP